MVTFSNPNPVFKVKDLKDPLNELHTTAEELLKSRVITGDYCPPVVQFEPTYKLIKGLHNIVGGLNFNVYCTLCFLTNLVTHQPILHTYTLCPKKKLWSRTLAITLSNLNRFQNFLHCCKGHRVYIYLTTKGRLASNMLQ